MSQSILHPTDAKSSVKSAVLLRSYREMYLMIRIMHLLSKPGSAENKSLLEFMKNELFNEQWTDREKVQQKISNGMRVIQRLGSAESAHSSPVAAAKSKAPLHPHVQKLREDIEAKLTAAPPKTTPTPSGELKSAKPLGRPPLLGKRGQPGPLPPLHPPSRRILS